MDPQNRDNRMVLRVFGEVWAWIDVFMLVSYQYTFCHDGSLKSTTWRKKHFKIMFNKYENQWK